MPCENSFTTKTGKFTAHRAKVSKSEAEAMCWANGQEPASFTDEEDMRAAVDTFNRNNCHYDPDDPEKYGYLTCDSDPGIENCPYSSDVIEGYHVGLYFEKRADGGFKKTFSNGTPWNEAEHSKLYYKNPEQKWQCPVAGFYSYHRDFSKGYLFGIGEHSYYCNRQQSLNYMCLAPAGRAISSDLPVEQFHPVEQLHPVEKFHPVEQLHPVFIRPLAKSRGFQVGTLLLVGMCALVAFVSACVVAVFYRKKYREVKEKLEANSCGI